jgi:tetratricopeptide (TPR) repeat protein
MNSGRGWRLSAAPAVLAGLMALAAAGASVVLRSSDLLADRYDRESSRLLKAGDNSSAIFCCERLNQLVPGRPENLFNLVLALDASGERRRAESIARRLAPVEYLKHAPAALWLARRVCASATITPAAARDAERLLRSVPEGDPLRNEARSMLGCLLLGLGKPAEAEVELRAAAVDRPELLLLLARARQLQGKAETAREAAFEAKKVWRVRHDRRPGEVRTRVNLAASTSMLGDPAGAEAILEAGLKLGDSAELHRALASLLLNWPGEPGTPADQLARVERGLRHDPTNEGLLVRLGQLTRAGGSEADRARAILRDRLTRGESPALAHFVLGIDADERGQKAEARAHWEQALRLAPGFAAVANNLACLLADSEPPELDRALQLSEAALRGRPDEPRFRDTRGRVLLKMGRWNEAVADLEAVLASRAKPAGLHEALARAYEGLGETTMAAEHRRLARGAVPKG